MNGYPPPPPEDREREEDQEDILATALYLSQTNPNLWGMSAEAWVTDAKHMRRVVKAIGDTLYSIEETL